MMAQIINILTMFLAFALAYNQAKVHNMLAIMLDLHFKNMKVIKILWAMHMPFKL
jgi:hypothetical protein